MKPGTVRFWKPFLYPQYFVPHAFQITVYPPFEFLFTWINRRMFQGKRRP